ncbi:MAG: cytidine deaminase [Eubacteriales bacterium]
MTDRELYILAKEVSKNAYAPFSKFCVGAALLSKNGAVYLGVNVENSSYGGTICAERAAVLAAVTAGEREFESIAIVANDSKVFPCGICRQFLYEFEPNLRVIIGNDEKSIEVYKLNELLTNGFRIKCEC